MDRRNMHICEMLPMCDGIFAVFLNLSVVCGHCFCICFIMFLPSVAQLGPGQPCAVVELKLN